jgi:Putative addiction module component
MLNARIQTSTLKQSEPMLTLEQLISEAIALPDAGKAILIEKIVESMAGEIDRDTLVARVQKAQERLAEIDSGAVQTVPGDIALAQIRQLAKK